jgi:Tfp pilus assembly protein PilZ
MLTGTHLVATQSDSLRQVWVALDLEAGEVVWASATGEQVRAASGSRVLTFAETEDGQRVARIIDVSDSSQVAQIGLPADTSANPNFDRADQIFDGRRFVFGRSRDPDSPPGRIIYFDGESRRRVELGERVQEGPVLIEGGFAAIVQGESASGDSNLDVLVYREATDSTARVTETDAREQGLVSDGVSAAWATSDAVSMLKDARASPTPVYEGNCGRLSVDEGSLAFLCRTEETDYWPDGPVSGEVLRVYDGSEVRTVESAESPIYLAALDGGRVAWIQPMSDSEGSPGVGRESRGRVMVAGGYNAPAVDTGARTGFPCFTCGALWPPVHLSMEGGRIAWSYERTGEDPENPGGPGGVGYAISQGCP